MATCMYSKHERHIKHTEGRRFSTVTTKAEGIVSLPGRCLGCVVVAISLAKTTVLFSDAGETTSFSPFVDWVSDPVDSCVTTNSFVIWVDQDNLIILINTVLVDPVRVQNSQISTPPTDSFLGNTSETSLGFEMVYTLAHGLAVCGTFRDMLFAVTPPDTDTVNHITLLGLVTQSASLVRARRARSSVDDIQLAVFPAPHTEEESKDIRLFLFVKLANVFVRAHFCRQTIMRTRESVLRTLRIISRITLSQIAEV